MRREPLAPSASGGETVFTYAAPDLKLGAGARAEVGHDLAALGVTRVLLVTDAGVAATGTPARSADQVRSHGLHVEVYDGVHVEPTDASLQAAVDQAHALGPFDGFLAVGGGSTIDTAKAVNLMTSCPGELMDYVNAPVGGGRAPERPLEPLVAIPTTTGTGSESTTICGLDVLSHKVKTGISHASLRPTLAVVDPELTFTQPASVTAASGMDMLCRAAALLAPDAQPDARPGADAGGHLPSVLAHLMRDVGLPSGLAEVGFTESDVPALVEGAMVQQRLLATCPREVHEDDLAAILTASAENW